jgi:cytochrome c oxidase assembly protein subunit 15
LLSSSSTFDPQRRPVAFWLLACCALVFAMVVVGGVTRLTHSGLSIVEWQPIVGAIPPLDDAQWQETFDKYKLTPEFRLRNHDMTLAGFKAIFWWEYAHRLLGRVIGLVFILPLAYFWRRGLIDRALGMRLIAVFALGGVQGAVGWYMVKSGLVDDPRVSSLRLATHLGIAFILHALMFWIALTLLYDPVRDSRGPRKHAGLVVALAFFTVIAGALVAGIRAGFAYNTFPLMNGHWVPPEILSLEPLWKNFVYNMATVQFVHRVAAVSLVALAAILWWRIDSDARVHDRVRPWSQALLAAAVVQAGLGIATLLLRVPLWLAALHQAGAFIVFTCALGLRHSLRR